ncbi:MAG TPA: DUF2730 family protein [Acidobacteriaceae bacterium]|nr:DUF2730 family protein [Acidobacteriaceae bacterium]
MTSKLDTAGLVAELREAERGGQYVAPETVKAWIDPHTAGRAADLIEALTHPAAPDMEPVAWRVKDYADGWILCHTRAQAEREAENGNLIERLYSASQLYALQERVERAEARVEQLENSEEWQRLTMALEAAEARVAEAEAALSQIQNLADMLIAAHDPGADLSAMSGHEAQRRVHAFVREVAPAIEAIATVARAALAHKGEGR